MVNEPADPYIVATCRLTYQLLQWGWSRHGLWTPTYHLRRPQGMVRVCAIPAYVFVPRRQWARCGATVHPKFNLRPLCDPTDGTPRVVPLQALWDMEQRLRDLYGATTEEVSVWRPAVGSRVEFSFGPFTGLEGVVDKVRANSIRVLLGTKYVTVDRGFLTQSTNEDL